MQITSCTTHEVHHDICYLLSRILCVRRDVTKACALFNAQIGLVYLPAHIFASKQRYPYIMKLVSSLLYPQTLQPRLRLLCLRYQQYYYHTCLFTKPIVKLLSISILSRACLNLALLSIVNVSITFKEYEKHYNLTSFIPSHGSIAGAGKSYVCSPGHACNVAK